MPPKSLLDGELKVEVAETLLETPHSTDATTTHTSLKPTSPYGFFDKLPSELRIQVWNGVLVSDKDLYDAFKFMSPQQPLMVATCPPINGIDAALLRTSRAIYEETLPILYGENHFVFYAPSQIPTFAFGELCKLPGRSSLSSSLGPSLERYGRLSMVRSVTLQLANLSTVYIDLHQRGLKVHQQEAIWSSWAEFFQPSSGQQSLTFPMLEELVLDFSHWGLDGSDASKLRIEPILRNLRPSGGLQRLWIAGVKHEQNLIDLKHGFLKNRGRFMALEDDNTVIAEGTVLYNDLHSVSKGVRDILQKDGVSALKLV